MSEWTYDALKICIAFLLVLVNGLFVSAEFALVKVRRSRLKEMVRNQRLFAATAYWLTQRLDASLSACQLGITIASLGLGWIGEPAVAHLLRPLLEAGGITSEVFIHGMAFVIAFGAITAAHLVLGEQAPKITAIRNPETVLLWSAAPLKAFYFLSYPLMVSLNATTAMLLRVGGIKETSEYEIPHSEDEIRALVRQAHAHGELSRSEHRLISAVFDFDSLICRQVMVPRVDVVFLDADSRLQEVMEITKRTEHSRYPICEGSLDHTIGVVHIKDIIGHACEADLDLRAIMRPPQFFPETLPVRRLLRRFQASRQHMAFLVDEHGTVTGVITLENVLEPIIGSVEDEFDHELPEVVAENPLTYVVSGAMSVDGVNRRFGLNLDGAEVDTLAGLLTGKLDRLLVAGDRIELPGVVAEVLEVRDRRALRIRLTLLQPPPDQI